MRVTGIRRDPGTGALFGEAAVVGGLPQTLSNLGKLATDGIDVQLNYQKDVGFAKWALSANGNWTNIGPTSANYAINGGTLNVTDAGRVNAIVTDPGNVKTCNTCHDGIKDGKETAADCGGGFCPKCADTLACVVNIDCLSGICIDNVCKPSCGDGVKNGTETDIDCGGSCSPCGTNKDCLVAADCASSVCSGTPLKCQAATCSDTVQNGSETDVDCGGSACPKCGPNKGCTVDADCVGGSCSGSVCLPTCTDNVKNGGETDVDCDPGEVCTQGVCIGKCDCAPCGVGNECNPTSGACVPSCPAQQTLCSSACVRTSALGASTPASDIARAWATSSAGRLPARASCTSSSIAALPTSAADDCMASPSGSTAERRTRAPTCGAAA